MLIIRRQVSCSVGPGACGEAIVAGIRNPSQQKTLRPLWHAREKVVTFNRELLTGARRPYEGANTMNVRLCPFLQFVGAAAAVVLVTLSGDGAWSQTRSINIVVPYNPGGPQDTVARVLAEQVGRAQGRTIVIENRPGASTAIGTEAVSRAAPDGNTLLINAPALVFTPYVRKVNYDPLTSFEPICYLASFPTVILVNNASPYRTFADLLSAARAKPGELTFASFGPATAEQVVFEMLRRAANVNMTFIPYPGYAPAVSALLGEHVTSVLADYSSSAQQLAAGKLRALVTLSRTRIEALPNVPTMADLGYKDIQLDGWSGLFAPAKTPKETVSQLADWFAAAAQAPEVKAKLVAQGYYPVGMCGNDFIAFVRKQHDEYGRAIRELNFKVE
jgi:tripartite-type tricarboxylate transporter receptor subunit TctC